MILSPSAHPTSRAKILMLHGHGQSGQFFGCKARVLESVVEDAIKDAGYTRAGKASSPSSYGTVQFCYPCGRLPANPDHAQDEDNYIWAWGYGDHHTGRIYGLQQSVEYIFEILERYGPFIGVVGFSTGAALAAIITSLLEKRESMSGFSFKTMHPPLKFAVCCSGFKLDNDLYAGLYSPRIKTPILHTMGVLDTMIEPKESLQLADFCSNASLYSFFGTHYVPRTAEFQKSLARFIKNSLAC